MTLALAVRGRVAATSREESLATRITDLLAAERFEEARILASEAVGREPGDPVLHMLAGVAALRSGNETVAARHLEEAARIDPDLPGLAFQRGALEMRRCSREKPGR